MFGKLLKHDFFATGRFMAVVYAVFAIVAVYLVGSVHFSGNELDSIGEMLSYIALCLIAFVNFILTAVVVMSNFQKTLYGDQGYLTFTLPVKSSSVLPQLIGPVIISKLYPCISYPKSKILYTLYFNYTYEKNLNNQI